MKTALTPNREFLTDQNVGKQLNGAMIPPMENSFTASAPRHLLPADLPI